MEIEREQGIEQTEFPKITSEYDQEGRRMEIIVDENCNRTETTFGENSNRTSETTFDKYNRRTSETTFDKKQYLVNMVREQKQHLINMVKKHQ